MFRGQATDLEIQRQEIRNTKRQLVEARIVFPSRSPACNGICCLFAAAAV